MGSPNVSDPYMPSYYAPYMSFPNMNQGGLSEGAAWSNGSDPMSFIGGYGQHMGSEYMSGNGMFGGFADYNQPGFGWGFPGGDYSAWGPGTTQGRKPDERDYMDSYYAMGGAANYANMNGEMDRDGGMKSVEQGLKGVSLSDKQEGGRKDVGQGGSSGGGTASSSGSQAPKKMTWASIASQPARPQPKLQAKSIPRAPVLPGKHSNMDIGTWDGKNSAKQGGAQQPRGAWGAMRGSQGRSGGGSGGTSYSSSGPSGSGSSPSGGSGPAPSNNPSAINHPVLEKLRSANQYNPKDFNLNPKGARFFVIKSYSEDDIHRSIKYSIWCSTEHGNKRLDMAYREREGKGPVYLLFSVNGSGHFCGMAQMMSALDYGASSNVWAQDKWKGQFEVKWIFVKDVPNSQLRHIRLENNENKPVTNSRDTQEVPPDKGKQILRIMSQYRHNTSIFDDFSHYEKRQEDDVPKPSEASQRVPERGGQGSGRSNGSVSISSNL